MNITSTKPKIPVHNQNLIVIWVNLIFLWNRLKILWRTRQPNNNFPRFRPERIHKAHAWRFYITEKVKMVSETTPFWELLWQNWGKGGHHEEYISGVRFGESSSLKLIGAMAFSYSWQFWKISFGVFSRLQESVLCYVWWVSALKLIEERTFCGSGVGKLHSHNGVEELSWDTGSDYTRITKAWSRSAWNYVNSFFLRTVNVCNYI